VGCCVSKGKEDEGGISTAVAKEGLVSLMIFCKPSCQVAKFLVYTRCVTLT
jgi:hypothetical protein